MSGFAEALLEFRKTGTPGSLLDAIPYARFMGFEIEVIEGEVRGTMVFSPHLVGNPALPALHGGTLGALLESVSIFQILFQSEGVVVPKTISNTVQYLRSGRPQDTFARCTITKHGRRVINVRSEAWQEDPARPIAAANSHFLIGSSDG